MFLLLILPILVSGFIVCNTNPNYFYRLHRYEGQYLYLKSAHLGVLSLLAFSLIALFCNYYLPSAVCFFGKEITIDIISIVKVFLRDVLQPKTESDLISFSWIVVLSFGSILYSYFWSEISKIRLYFKTGSLAKSKILLMSEVLSDSPLDKLFFESYINSRPLLLTLKSKKIYVGPISSLGEPNESEGMDQEISLIPLMSGFRDKEKLTVNFTTFYDSVDTDLNIIIRQDQVLSSSWFDFEIYKKLNTTKPKVRWIHRYKKNKVKSYEERIPI